MENEIAVGEAYGTACRGAIAAEVGGSGRFVADCYNLTPLISQCILLTKENDMIGIQPTDILIIILVAVIIFAPMRLPQMVRGLKGMFAEFRKEVRQTDTSTEAPKKKP